MMQDSPELPGGLDNLCGPETAGLPAAVASLSVVGGDLATWSSRSPLAAGPEVALTCPVTELKTRM